jgi:glutamyl-tRNA reductase
MTNELPELYEAYAQKVREEAVIQAQKDLAKGMDPDRVLEKMSKQLSNKLLHPVLTGIKESASIDMEEFARSREEYFEKMKHIGPKSDHVQ